MPDHPSSLANRIADPDGLVRKAGHQSDDDPFEFIMATGDVDRVGDIIEIDGMDLAGFEQNPIALFAHDSRSPVGTWENLRKRGGRLVGQLRLAAKGTSPLIDRLRSLIEQRIVRAVSVGFRPLEYSDIKGTGGLRFTQTELLECSVVAIPANAGALRIKGLAPDPIDRQIFGGAPPRTGPMRAGGRAPSPPERRAAAPSGTGTRTMTTVSEKIVAHQARTVEIDDQLATIEAAATNDNNRDFTDDEHTQIAALAEEKQSLVRSIEALTTIERAQATRARPVTPVPLAEARPRSEKPGSLLLKVGVCHWLAHVGHRSIDSVIAERYRDDERVKAASDYIIKAATDIADTLTPGWASQLVSTDVRGFLEDLKAVSVYAGLSMMGVGVDFGNNGSITVPRRQTRGDMAGAFVGEAGVIPVVQGTIGSQTLNRYKLAAISTFSKELERTSSPVIESVMREAIRNDAADLLDTKLLDTVAMVAGVRPAGLLNGVTLTPSAGNTAGNIATDIKVLLGVLVSANALRKPVILINPIRLVGLSLVTTATGEFIYKDDVAEGRLFNVPFISSTNVPATTVIILDAADFGTAFGVPEFDVSDTATLTMANADGTAPTQAVDAAGVVATPGQVGVGLGIPVRGGPAGAGTAGVVGMSMFQQWAVALRMVMPISWAMLRPGSIGGLSGVNW